MKITNISKQVIFLGLVSFFTDFASEMLYPVTPIFLTSVLGASMVTVGIIEGIAEVTAGLLKGYFGVLSDKLGKRSIFVLAGYGLSGLVKSIPGIFPNIPVVVASRILDRVGKGIRTSPRDALLAANAKENTGAVFGFHRSMDTFGAVAGPLVAIGVLTLLPGDFRTVYLLAFLPSLFAFFFTLKVHDKQSAPGPTKKNLIKQLWKISPREYKLLVLVMSIFSFVNSSDVFLILKSKEITGSDTSAILGYVFYNLVYAFLAYPIGILSDKIGKKNVFVIGLFSFSAVYLGFALNGDFIYTLALFILYGVYSAASEGVTRAWVSDLIPEEYRGSAIGLLNFLTSIFIMAGSVLAGYLWDEFGAKVPFLISALTGFIMAILIFILKKRPLF